MPPYTFTVNTLNGVNINDGVAYRSYFSGGDPSPMTTGNPAEAVVAQLPTVGDRYVRTQPKSTTWLLTTELLDLNQSSLDAFYKTFSQHLGLVHLVISDGIPTTWRVGVQVLSAPVRIEPGVFKTALFVPNAIWERPSGLLDSVTDQTTTPFSFAITPAGNMPTDDVLITSLGLGTGIVKSAGFDDYKWSLSGFIINRSIHELFEEPIYLLDSNGAASRLATDSSTAGATVRQANGSGGDVSAAGISAGATSFVLTNDTDWPAKGLFWVEDTRGDGFHDQGYFGSRSGTTLNDVVWLAAAAPGRDPSGTPITAGGIAHTQAQVGTIQPSGIHMSADDLAVWMDGTRLADDLVTPVDWYTNSSDVVALVDMPRRQTKTLATAMTASVPANGSELQFVEGVADLAEKGVCVINNELVAWTARNLENKSIVIRRAMHGSTAASHVVGSIADFSIKRYVVAVGKAKATPADRPLSRRPALQMKGSSNQTHKWGAAFTDDPNTVFYDKNNPSRPKSWRLRHEKDGNEIDGLIVPTFTSIWLAFQDTEPTEGLPPANSVEVFIPQGFNGVSPFTVDVDPDAEVINSEIHVTDGSGWTRMVREVQQAASLSTGPGALTPPNYKIKFKARYNVVTGYRTTTANSVTIDNTSEGANQNGNVAVRFTVDRPFLLSHVICLMSIASGTQDVIMTVMEDKTESAGFEVPEEGDEGLIHLSAVVNISGATPTLYKFPFVTAAAPPRYITPGTYWLMTRKRTTFPGNNVTWYNNSTSAAAPRRMRAAKRTAGTWNSTIGTPYFLICSTYDGNRDAPIQIDQPVRNPSSGNRTGIGVIFDNVVVTLYAPQSAYVHRMGGFANTWHHFAMTAERTSPAGGGKVSVDRWGPIASSVSIDCAKRICTYTENGYTESFGAALDPTGRYISLEAANNTLQISEPDLVQWSYLVSYRARRV